MEKNFEITREMVHKGIDQGLVKIIKEDENSPIVCQIGEYWFYFCGAELENLSLEEFLKVTNKEDNINCIYEMLRTFNESEVKDLFEDEYKYYYHFLMENLK